jgi:hypothetical protein
MPTTTPVTMDPGLARCVIADLGPDERLHLARLIEDALATVPNRRFRILIATIVGGLVGHYVGDYLVQTDHDALRKHGHVRPNTPIDDHDHRTPGQRTRDGWVSLTRHCVTYAMTQAGWKLAIYRVTHTKVPWEAQVLGAMVAALLHGVVDDTRLLTWYCVITKKLRFYKKADHGINGAALLDQGSHLGLSIPIAALFTLLFAELIGRARGRGELLTPGLG